MAKPVTLWGRNLKRIIREQGLKQGEVAVAAGLDKNGISRLYRAEVTKSDTLEHLAAAMGVDVAELFAPDAGRDLSRHTRRAASPDAHAVAPREIALAALQDAAVAITNAVTALRGESPAARTTAASRPRVHRKAG